MSHIDVFDLDDTLIDSEIRFSEGVFAILDEEGIAYDAEELKRLTIPMGLTGTAQYYRNVLGVRGSVDEILERIEKKMHKLYAERIAPKLDAVAYLNPLSRAGHRLFVLTATPHSLADVCLKRHGLFSLFERVWSVDDFGFPKSDVRLFEAVANTLGTAGREIRYYDDSFTALKNAKTVGFRTHAVCNHLLTRAQTKEYGQFCDVIFRSFDELPRP
ncbi:MAG: HAD family hydrolase [Clostridia bacterium]|nr:HAD family hydrolase [Clostridia bacterium]